MSIAACVVALDDVKQYYPEIEVGDLIGYIDKNGDGDYDETEEVQVGDDVEEGVIIKIKDLCHNW